MEKTEINNEFILLRHTVRQARTCIVNKLIRETKLLRDKNGNEVQREKNKRKADKLVAEVRALKTIKEDEISKFGIINEREMKDILQDQSSSDRDRIIARIVNYKSFHRRLMQFRERFPDYKIYFGKKKTTKLKKKNSAKIKKLLAENNHHSQYEDTKEQDIDSNKIIEDSQHDSTDEQSCESRLCETENNSDKHKKSLSKDSTALVNKKLPKLIEDNTSEDINEQPSGIKLCSVTREATVKRFAEILEEQDSTKDAQMSVESLQTNHERATVQAKPVDDFFITGNNEEGYQENYTKASASHTRFNTPVKTLRSSSQVKTQNPRFRNEKRIGDNKTQRINQFEKQSRGEMTRYNKHLNKQPSVMKQEKRTSNRINKSTNKNNLSFDNREETADLHPSWLAKKKQQEMMSQGFQGKKIVFADD